MKFTDSTELISILDGRIAQEMKGGDKLTLGLLRSMKASLSTAETKKNPRRELTEKEAIDLLRSEAKTRRESGDLYESLGEKDRALIERTEAELIEEFLPRILDRDETTSLIEGVISKKSVPQGEKKSMGLIMSALKGRTDIDSRMASEITMKLLGL